MKQSGRALRSRIAQADGALLKEQGRLELVAKPADQADDEQRRNAARQLSEELNAYEAVRRTANPEALFRRRVVIRRLARRVAAAR